MSQLMNSELDITGKDMMIEITDLEIKPGFSKLNSSIDEYGLKPIGKKNTMKPIIKKATANDII